MSETVSKDRTPFFSSNGFSFSAMLYRFSPALLGLLSLYLLWMLITWPSLLPVKQVKVRGHFPNVGQMYLKNAITPEVSRGLLNLSVHKLQAQLVQLPWIEHATVRRIWPDGVEIELHQHEVLAKWGKRGFMTASGSLIYPTEVQGRINVPLVDAPAETQTEVYQVLSQIKTPLASISREVQKITVSPRHSWRIILDNDLELRLGREQIEQKMARFVQAYPTIFGQSVKHACYADLRYTKGISVSWQTAAGCTQT